MMAAISKTTFAIDFLKKPSVCVCVWGGVKILFIYEIDFKLDHSRFSYLEEFRVPHAMSPVLFQPKLQFPMSYLSTLSSFEIVCFE